MKTKQNLVEKMCVKMSILFCDFSFEKHKNSKLNKTKSGAE